MPKSNVVRLNHISFEFSNRMHKLTGMNSFYALSGSDANEGAIKLASAYQFEKGNHHKKTIVGFENSYHGSTFMTMSVGHDNFMDAPFYTLDRHQSVTRIPRDFTDDIIDWNSVAAIMIETCAYGKGSKEPDAEFWARLDKIRTEYDVLIIIDDIFMGGGKTGTYIGWENMNIRPDISTMGKAITGGFFPLSMVLYSDKIKNTLPNNFVWEHGFTYCFSLPGIASAVKYLDILERENLLANHNNIVDRAISVFNKCGFEVYFRFGLIFRIRRENETHFYVLPVNADDEYFEVLKENLEWFTQNTTH
jgi:putrescine aminotransferase